MLRQIISSKTDLVGVQCEVVADDKDGNWIVQFPDSLCIMWDIYNLTAEAGLSSRAQYKDKNAKLWSIGPGYFVETTGPDLFSL